MYLRSLVVNSSLMVGIACVFFPIVCFFFKQKTAYEMRISDWSSDVCSSDLCLAHQSSGGLSRRIVDSVTAQPAVAGSGAADQVLKPRSSVVRAETHRIPRPGLRHVQVPHHGC